MSDTGVCESIDQPLTLEKYRYVKNIGIWKVLIGEKYWYLWYSKSIDAWKIVKLEKYRYWKSIDIWKVLTLDSWKVLIPEKYWHMKSIDAWKVFIYIWARESMDTFGTWKKKTIFILVKYWHFWYLKSIDSFNRWENFWHLKLLIILILEKYWYFDIWNLLIFLMLGK